MIEQQDAVTSEAGHETVDLHRGKRARGCSHPVDLLLRRFEPGVLPHHHAQRQRRRGGDRLDNSELGRQTSIADCSNDLESIGAAILGGACVVNALNDDFDYQF